MSKTKHWVRRCEDALAQIPNARNYFFAQRHFERAETFCEKALECAVTKKEYKKVQRLMDVIAARKQQGVQNASCKI